MSSQTNDLMSMIESLPIDLRTALVEKILNSLHPLEKRIDELWVEEADRRVESIMLGQIETIPGDEVFKAIKGRFEV